MTALCQKAKFDSGQRKFIAKLRITAPQLLCDPVESGVDSQTGFGADNQKVDCIGQAFSNFIGTLCNQIVDIDIGSFVTKEDAEAAALAATEAGLQATVVKFE